MSNEFDFDFVDACEFREPPNAKVMTSLEIKAEIIRAGTTGAAIARFLGVSQSAVSHVIDGKARSARIEAEIIKIAGPRAFAPQKPKHKRAKTVWTGRVLEAV